MQTWDNTYISGLQINNQNFPEQFLVKIFFDTSFQQRVFENNLSSLLDLGCGFGRNIPLYKHFFSQIHCCDPSKLAIEHVHTKWQVPTSILRPPIVKFENKFDIIVACNSIYYLSNEFNFEVYFNNIIDCLNPNGLLLVSFIGPKHSILENAVQEQETVYQLKNQNVTKFKDRADQRVFVPNDNYKFPVSGLKTLIKGEICDVWNDETRHLKVFLIEKL